MTSLTYPGTTSIQARDIERILTQGQLRRVDIAWQRKPEHHGVLVVLVEEQDETTLFDTRINVDVSHRESEARIVINAATQAQANGVDVRLHHAFAPDMQIEGMTCAEATTSGAVADLEAAVRITPSTAVTPEDLVAFYAMTYPGAHADYQAWRAGAWPAERDPDCKRVDWPRYLVMDDGS